ncbi:MAG: MltA domain-containing protein, partial [Thiovulaceae bacterium]|nr:MltA domain-containing protein [Sulfurimonadaceae bacterium]
MKKSFLSLLFLLLFFAGCTPALKHVNLTSKNELILKPLTFEELPSWQEHNFTQAFKSFKKGCRVRRKSALLEKSCRHVDTDMQPKAFFEHYFTPYLWLGSDEKETGLVTGYYEPLLQGSLKRSSEYSVPLLKRPDDLLIIDLASLYPSLKGKSLRGRLKGNKVVPYYSRKQITQNPDPKNVLCWVKDKVDLFFLQVQGSGRIQLDANKTLFVGYGDKNGHDYRSIGRYMLDHHYMQYHEMSLQGIKQWAINNPDKIDDVLNQNPSYLFFVQNKTPAKGAMGIVLTPEHSLAVDTKYLPLGLPIFVTTQHPIKKVPF